MKENKTQSKQAKHKRIFLRLRHQSPWLAGHYQTQSARTRSPQNAGGHKIRADSVCVKILARTGEREVADGIGHSALPAPRNSVAGRITQRRRAGHANAHIINGRIVEQIDVADGSGVSCGGGLEGDFRLPV